MLKIWALTVLSISGLIVLSVHGQTIRWPKPDAPCPKSSAKNITCSCHEPDTHYVRYGTPHTTEQILSCGPGTSGEENGKKAQL